LRGGQSDRASRAANAASATVLAAEVIGRLVLVLFMIWCYTLSDAFVVPLMPNH